MVRPLQIGAPFGLLDGFSLPGSGRLEQQNRSSRAGCGGRPGSKS